MPVHVQVDPTLTRADRLVGQVLGEVGALPDVYTELEINFFLLRRLLGVRTEVGCSFVWLPSRRRWLLCASCQALRCPARWVWLGQGGSVCVVGSLEAACSFSATTAGKIARGVSATGVLFCNVHVASCRPPAYSCLGLLGGSFKLELYEC